MKLAEIVDNLEAFDDTLCIVVKRPWSKDSEAKVVQLMQNFAIPDELLSVGYEYFLEVDVALREVLGGVAVDLSPDQRLAAVVFYAENDAFPDWLCELRP